MGGVKVTENLEMAGAGRPPTHLPDIEPIKAHARWGTYKDFVQLATCTTSLAEVSAKSDVVTPATDANPRKAWCGFELHQLGQVKSDSKVKSAQKVGDVTSDGTGWEGEKGTKGHQVLSKQPSRSLTPIRTMSFISQGLDSKFRQKKQQAHLALRLSKSIDGSLHRDWEVTSPGIPLDPCLSPTPSPCQRVLIHSKAGSPGSPVRMQSLQMWSPNIGMVSYRIKGGR